MVYIINKFLIHAYMDFNPEGKSNQSKGTWQPKLGLTLLLISLISLPCYKLFIEGAFLESVTQFIYIYINKRL